MSMRKDMVSKSNERIADLLAAYGSDVSRWPERERNLVEALTPADRAAVFAETRALDQILTDAAHTVDNSSPSNDLMARIMQATEAPGHKAEANVNNADVVTLDAAKQHQQSAAMTKREWTAAAALLAASLVLGVFVGSNERIQTTVLGIGEVAGVRIEPASAQISALDAALQFQDDEDLL